jgi:hypothetical protein
MNKNTSCFPLSCISWKASSCVCVDNGEIVPRSGEGLGIWGQGFVAAAAQNRATDSTDP